MMISITKAPIILTIRLLGDNRYLGTVFTAAVLTFCCLPVDFSFALPMLFLSPIILYFYNYIQFIIPPIFCQ